jgi:hypothetical protein
MQTKRHVLAVMSILFLLVGCSHYAKVSKRPIRAITESPEQKNLYRSTRLFSKQPLMRLGNYLDSADSARLKLAEDPGDSVAQSDYDFAVARIVEIIENEKLKPWDTSLSCPSKDNINWSLTLTPPDPRPEYHPSNFRMLPSDRYRFKGTRIGERVQSEGMGAPVIVIGKDLDFTKIDQFSQGKHVYYGLTSMIRFDGRNCAIEFVDPLEKETLSLDGYDYPLASDFQAPLALSMADSHPKKTERGMMFNPQKYEMSSRLSRLQPYDPSKTPIIFIHGLGDSEATWMPLINHLRNDVEVRNRYQFWIFSYSTGLPYPIPAAQLRLQMDQMNVKYPNHKDFVIVGHSLGGNIARLLISDSDMKIWDTYYDKPPAEIPFHEETREVMSAMLIFKARPDVSRVIFANASLRGSETAIGLLGRLGAKLIGNPITKDQINREALKYARPEFRTGRKHLPNSVEILDPGSTFLGLANSLPIVPHIPYHVIIGDQGKGGNLDKTNPQITDGVVPYWSAHLDGAQSETIIPSKHWGIHHPAGMAEVKRILIQQSN